MKKDEVEEDEEDEDKWGKDGGTLLVTLEEEEQEEEERSRVGEEYARICTERMPTCTWEDDEEGAWQNNVIRSMVGTLIYLYLGIISVQIDVTLGTIVLDSPT